MPVLKLVAPDAPILRTPTPRMGPKLTKTESRAIADMTKTLESISDALAIAAPQVGIPLRIFVIRSKSDIDAVIDPTIVWTSISDPTEIILGPGNAPVPRVTSYWERCLSFPDQEFLIDRPYIVTIRFRNVRGVERKMSYQAWPGRVILHEMAHLDGLVLPERAEQARSVAGDDDMEMWRI